MRRLHLRPRGRTRLVALVLLAAACAEEPVCLSPSSAGEVAAPPAPACDNEQLERYDGLLVLAPHPDDEVLAFAGLVDAYLQQGKPVEVVVVTDGDAYCEACWFWKSGSIGGPLCTAEELSNLATPAVDSFAEVRREESRRALARLGADPPLFLGYPDIGIRIAWNRGWLGAAAEPLQRSDFSGCDSCETCAGGYAQGPATELTAASLAASLERLVAATPPRTLVATTHWLDRHGDHTALGNLVKRINDGLAEPRPVAYGVIHAHTSKDLPLPECWYPAPRAVQCDCAEEACAEADPVWLAAQRAHRYRPDWPATLPDDAPYGEAVQLCLREEMVAGPEPLKLAAIETYASQTGAATRQGPAPAHLRGIVDCSGYLLAFARRTEAFVLHDPASAETACEPSGSWRGDRVEATPEGRPAPLARRADAQPVEQRRRQRPPAVDGRRGERGLGGPVGRADGRLPPQPAGAAGGHAGDDGDAVAGRPQPLRVVGGPAGLSGRASLTRSWSAHPRCRGRVGGGGLRRRADRQSTS